MRILLIEDDKKLCDTLTYQLERENIRTDVCHRGTDGLDLMLSGGYDLVLLDRMLPSLDGISVLKAARKGGIQTPVILRLWENFRIKSMDWTAALTTI